eukprot:6214107-Pleurochrysis_carterae.AAC.6
MNLRKCARETAKFIILAGHSHTAQIWRALFGSCERVSQGKCRRCERAGGAPAPALPPGMAGCIASHRRSNTFRQHARRQGGSMSNGTIKQHGRAVPFN